MGRSIEAEVGRRLNKEFSQNSKNVQGDRKYKKWSRELEDKPEWPQHLSNRASEDKHREQRRGMWWKTVSQPWRKNAHTQQSRIKDKQSTTLFPDKATATPQTAGTERKPAMLLGVGAGQRRDCITAKIDNKDTRRNWSSIFTLPRKLLLKRYPLQVNHDMVDFFF